ncbi:MAG: DNA polymerase domain-containing protein, partial [Candidatus Thorarchaeota archaeon]
SMYPSVCVAHNIGGETLKKLAEMKSKDPLEMFHTKPQSCLALMQETLIKRREITKQTIKSINTKLVTEKDKKNIEKFTEEKKILDKEQYSLKIVANSMYGAHNYIRSRFYSITLGNAITNIARTYILRMESLLTEVTKNVTPVEIIYGDTDSAFIKILDQSVVTDVYNETNDRIRKKYEDKLMEITNRILKTLNSKFPPAMELTLEDIAYKLIFKPGRAKAYSYYSILSNELNITGFEAVRSDWSYISREAQTKVLELILKSKIDIAENSNGNIIEQGILNAKDYLIKLGIDIFKMPPNILIPKTTIRSPIKRNPRKYKTKVPVVLAFLDYAKREGLNPDTDWKEFDKFPWVIIPGKGILSDRARHPKYAQDVDRDHYITEILRASEGFGVKVTLQDIKNKMTIEPIDEILKRLPQSEESNRNSEKTNTVQIKPSTKQTKISTYFDDEEVSKKDKKQ